MRTETDALRSVQRFFADIPAFAEPWEIVLVDEQGSPPVRPYVLVEQLDQAAPASAAPSQQSIILPTAVAIFPAKYDTRAEADQGARDIREAVYMAVKFGAPIRSGGPPTSDYIPLWDYDPTSVPPGRAVPYRNYNDFMQVSSFGMQTLRESADPTMLMIAVDLRLTFARPLPLPSRQLLRSITLKGGPTG